MCYWGTVLLWQTSEALQGRSSRIKSVHQVNYSPATSEKCRCPSCRSFAEVSKVDSGGRRRGGIPVRTICHINASFCTDSSAEYSKLGSTFQHRRRLSKSSCSSSMAKIVDPRPTEYCPRRGRVWSQRREDSHAGRRTEYKKEKEEEDLYFGVNGGFYRLWCVWV